MNRRDFIKTGAGVFFIASAGRVFGAGVASNRVRLAIMGCREGLEKVLGPDRRAQWERTRSDVLSWFEENFYGRAPLGKPADLVVDPRGFTCAGGKVGVRLEVALPPGASKAVPVPVVVFGDHFRDGKPYPDVPVEEILRRGYAFVRYNFNEIAPDRKVDDPKRIDGVFKAYGGWDKPDGWGKVAAWAWGFSRVVDWIETRPELDAARVTVVGHSRGGKTALWAAANDVRIALAVANGSGTGGAHLNALVTPGSEQVPAFLGANSWNFFCPNFLKLEGRETKLAHDADDLLRLIAPRLVYVASGSKDTGAGPQGEFEAARRAGELWEAYGRHGVSLKAYPAPGTVDHAGDIGYHLHDGRHVLGVWDWQRILDFADAKLRSVGNRL